MTTTSTLTRGVDELIRWCPWFILVGLVFWIAGDCLEKFGVIFGSMALWFGACCGMCSKWRSERGIWMLSGFFLAITAIVGALVGYFVARDIIHHRLDIFAVAESLMAGMIVLMQMLFLTAVTYLNSRIRTTID
ncbi:hypothetical protein ACFL02_01640 [Planctomycetota bacterium]